MENLETEEIKQSIMKLEFQHKKDNAEADRRFNERFDRMQIQLDQTQAHLNHLTKLAGISFEKFADIESRMEKAGDALKPQAESK